MDRVFGFCEPPFQKVRDVFLENFESHGEVGGGVSVILEGKTLVDLWGGWQDEAKTIPWERNSLVSIQSVVKGVIAICALQLVDRGQLDLEKPVAQYWPEFGQAGKEDITVAHLLSHMAGLVYPDKAPRGAFTNWPLMIQSLERQGPEWEPGTVGAYHSSTYGFLVGELVRRVSGKWIDQYLRDEIARPLGVDFHFTLDASRHDQVAEFIMCKGPTIFDLMDEKSKLGRAWRVFTPTDDFWGKEGLTTLTPHAYSNARALARIFGALSSGGELDGVRFMGSRTVDTARKEVWSDTCALMDQPVRMAMGMFMGSRDFVHMGPNPNSYGALGAGGATCFADPDLKMGFGYAMNLMCEEFNNGPRAARLIDAVYSCL